MHVNEENFETDAYFVEHILDVPDYKKLISNFKAGNDATGLETYLKYAAVGDENVNLARTYLVIDKSTKELACYFSLRTGLITVQVSGNEFDSLPAADLCIRFYNTAQVTLAYKNNLPAMASCGII